MDSKSSRLKVFFGHKCKIWRGQWAKNLNMESKILCPRHLLGASASIFMIAVICHKFVIVYKPMRTETGLPKCLNLFFLKLFSFMLCFFLSIGCYPETKKQFLRMVGFLMLSGSNLFTMKSLLDTWRARFLERWLRSTQD